MMRALHSFLIPVLACTQASAWNEPVPVVMVADLAGKVLRGGGQALTLAEGIPADRGLTLAPGARLVVIHLKTGDELTFAGPGTVHFDTEGRPLGAKPTGRRKVAALGEGFRLEPGAWAQASVGMTKEATLQAPFLKAEEAMPFNPPSAEVGQGPWLQPRGTAILETTPEFRWHLPLPGLEARLYLTDPAGARVLDERVRGDGLRLPPEKPLRPGEDYRWRLLWTLPDGQAQSAEGWFLVLPEKEAQLIQGLRPTADAPFAERLAFAAVLEAKGLLEEAHPYWIRLAAERPEDATLRRFAGR